MKNRKKPQGTKARVQAYKKRLAYIGHSIIIGILITLVAISSSLLYSMLNSPSEQSPINPTLQITPDNPDSQLKAAIVDHLSLTYPNQTFIQTATNTLKQAGYTVDYYPGEKVTVEFYRNLPTHEYSLIILRVHSTTGGNPFVFLFTSEPYSESKYVYEQLTDRLGPVAYSFEEAQKGIGYFGITPLFVKSNIKGKFASTVIIMMGCEGLKNTNMAEAFIEKGVKAYISWNGSISASHTDQATTILLQHLILEKQTIKQAIENTMKEVGPDPAYESLLIYYPLEAREQTIENITGES